MGLGSIYTIKHMTVLYFKSLGEQAKVRVLAAELYEMAMQCCCSPCSGPAVRYILQYEVGSNFQLPQLVC